MNMIALLLQNFQIVTVIILVGVGWYFGTRSERKHLANLDADERILAYIVISNERFYQPDTHADGVLVLGSVSIAQDYFKLMYSVVLSLFGKNLTVYERLLERGRREAVVRMKKQAQKSGYNHIYGVRIETSTIGNGGVEVLAYGTAVASLDNFNVSLQPPI
ncbi:MULTISPECIES: YbjQ family protein [unclassified Moraxella]|uniref:YbjQ family protein n=1 Tax=unclassified Moraxella TaxID=2685852 RepID=UPI00359CE600